MKPNPKAIEKARTSSRTFQTTDFNKVRASEVLMKRFIAMFDEGYLAGWRDREREFAKQLDIDNNGTAK